MGLIILLLLGFIAGMRVTIRNKIRQGHYQPVGPAHDTQDQKNHTSYQNSADYALPPKQNVVTYCVIDGRLVDQ